MFFAEAQLGLMYQQETVRRSLPLFGASAQGDTNGLAGGGGVRVGVQQTLGEWLIEPSLGFGGFHLRLGSLTETGGALAENIGGATLGSAESTLAVSAQRDIRAERDRADDRQGAAGLVARVRRQHRDDCGKLRRTERQRLRVEQRTDRTRRRAGRG